MITELIESNKTQFTGADRDWLTTQPEEIIMKLFPKNGNQRYTWMTAVCDALKESKPKTMEAWASKANEKYVEKGGKENHRTALNTCKYAADVLKHFPIDYEIPAK